MTRLSVFFSRRSDLTFMRRFFDAFVRGLPFIVGSFNFFRSWQLWRLFFYESHASQQGDFLLLARNRRKMAAFL
jgi:hypothetical protein